ncbi:uncharacterized protein M6B38_107280 [Iris pallida]|uniref:Uncharacterized protein n=1 Tax=Iris pallida TaxID=29817 RepID=A0AAX6EHE2_IRIPA|nr:uncharacterized protein M6B38_107280 [Iris pallida]
MISNLCHEFMIFLRHQKGSSKKISSRSTGGVSSSRRKSWDRPPGVAQQHHRRKSWDRPLVLAPLVPSQARRFVENGGFRDLHGTVLVVTRDQIPEPLWSRNLRVVAWWTISHFLCQQRNPAKKHFLACYSQILKRRIGRTNSSARVECLQMHYGGTICFWSHKLGSRSNDDQPMSYAPHIK